MTRKKRSKEGRKRHLKPQDEAPTEEGFQAQRAAEREDNPRGRSKEWNSQEAESVFMYTEGHKNCA